MRFYNGYEHDLVKNPDAENASCFEPDAVPCTEHINCRWHIIYDETDGEIEIHVKVTP